VRYTLVPVPSEYVLDVMRWVLFHAPDEDGQTTGRDEARVVQLLDQLDDFTRALVVLIAKSVAKDDLLTLRDAADELGQPPQAVSDSLRVINKQALWARDIVLMRSEPAVGVRGQKGKASFVVMRPDIARLVCAAERTTSVSGE
jgi:hypothetical protein